MVVIPEYTALRNERRALDIHQQEVADLLGIHRSMVSRFERYGVPLSEALTAEDYRRALKEARGK